MSKFKVGDKIIITKNCGSVCTVGKTGVIENISVSGQSAFITMACGYRTGSV